MGASSKIRSRTARVDSVSVTSKTRACASPPASRISRTTACAADSLRFACTYTRWPAAPSRRQIAAPSAPLPPVTSARTFGSLIAACSRRPPAPARVAGVEHDRCAAAHQGRARGAELELVQSRTVIAGHARGLAYDVRWRVIEPSRVHAHAAHAGQESRARAAARVSGAESAVHGHGLGRDLDAACDAETSIRPQRMSDIAVAAARAADAIALPVEHLVQQAHAAAVRDVRFDPAAIQAHGSISTVRLDPSRYSSTVRARRPIARCRSNGTDRAAGF